SGAPRLRRGVPNPGAIRGTASSGASRTRGQSRGATASPGRPEPGGNRGAPRRRRGVPSPGAIEGRHGVAGASRARGQSRGATASPGRPEPGGNRGAPRRRRGVPNPGAIEGRHGVAGASRTRGQSRGATASPGRPEPPGGSGGHLGAPSQNRNGSIRQRTRAQYAVHRAPYFSRQRRSSRRARCGKKSVSQSAGRYGTGEANPHGSVH